MPVLGWLAQCASPLVARTLLCPSLSPIVASGGNVAPNRGSQIVVVALVVLAMRAANAGEPGDEPSDELEIGALPALSYDSDVGFGFGVLAVLAQKDLETKPFRWRLETLISATTRRNQLGEWELPYHDDYVRLDVPDIAGTRVRLLAELGFRKFSNAGWYGLGSNATETRFTDAELREDERRKRFHQVDHLFPGGRLALRIPWIDVEGFRLDGFATVGVTYSHTGVYPQSRFEESIERRSAEAALRELFWGIKDHALIKVGGGLLLDSRDDEFSPSRGVYAELGLRAGVMTGGPRWHGGGTAAASGYVPLGLSWLVLAGRAMIDATWGDAPFYELSRIGTYVPEQGPGGGHGVRGVYARRFHGKIRCVGNLEVRATSPAFELWGNRFRVGAVAFTDSGRVWADYREREVAGAPLDGDAADWSVGLGGGMRVVWGSTFVIRIDHSRSPTEGTSGTYIGLGNLF
jgi:hypothetical protein